MSDAQGLLRKVTPGPHIESGETTQQIMLWVVACLAPAALYSVWIMGMVAVTTLAACIIAAVGTEYVWNLISKKPQTIFDGSALVTGLLLAMALPPRTPWWACVAGAFAAIALAKMLFGGLGFNIFNPALIGRAIVVISWPGVIAATENHGWFETVSLPATGQLDAITGATRLALASADRAANGGYGYDLGAQYGPLLLRNPAASLGEVSAALLILGGLVLILRGIIDWRIPVGYIGTVAALSFAFGSDPIFNVLAGGVLLGAFFMATDYVTSPMTKWGRLVFGVGCGIFNTVARFFGPAPEATTYAILFMNGLAPLIDRAFVPRVFGVVKARA